MSQKYLSRRLDKTIKVWVPQPQKRHRSTSGKLMRIELDLNM